MKKIIGLLVAALVLSGCETTPLAIPKAMGSKIIVLRDAGGLSNIACPFTIRVNGEKVAVLKPGESSTTPVAPGRYKVSAGPEGNGMCSSSYLTQIVEVNADPAVLRLGAIGSQIVFNQVE